MGRFKKAALLICVWFSSAAQLDFPKPAQFIDYVDTDAVSIKIYRPKEGAPWIWGRTQIPRAAKEVYAALQQFARYDRLFHESVASVKVLDKFEDGVRMHVVWPLPFPFSDRDAIVRYHRQTLENGAYHIRWHDAAKAGDPKEGLRIEQVTGRTLISPMDGQNCALDFIYFGELGGSLLSWIEEAAWKGEPFAYFNAIRSHFGLAALETP